MRERNLNALARRLVAAGGRPDPRKRSPSYYMFNCNYPLIAALYLRYKAANGLHLRDPAGDVERTEFELSLLNEGALREVEAYCEEQERAAAAKLPLCS